jgi:murein DD-endopeptidase MepM/ murein hydrolase activator NlpD
MLKKRIKVVVLAGLMMFAFGASTLANDLDRARERRQSIIEGLEDARGVLDSVRLEQNTVLEEIVLLDIELFEISQEYQYASDELFRTMLILEQTELELAEAEIRRDAQHELLRQRIRFMHENNSVTYIELLLTSANFSDFLDNMDRIGQIVEQDNNILEALIETENIIAARRDEIDARRMEIVLLTQDLTARRYALADIIAEKDYLMAQLQADEASHIQLIAQMERESNEIDALIQRLAAQEAQRQRTFATQQAAQQAARDFRQNGGSMGWPLPNNHRQISSHYGMRTIFGRREFHTGVDIRAPYGTNVLAAESGIVIFSAWFSGYGNTVIIDHGGGITTLYAHHSRNLVSVGQEVYRGQVIARVGRTGITTGPHLHFEVRLNGGHTDPRPFLGY